MPGQTSKPMLLGKLSVPASTQLEIPILQIHHDQALWRNSVTVKEKKSERTLELLHSH